MPSPIPSDAYIIIIGAMKAGTSSLYKVLDQHPSICAARMKEPEFFSQYQEHGLDVKKYEDVFNFDSSLHTHCLEASTGYTKFPHEVGVPKRMKEYGIDPYFIYSVRHPFRRIESEYNFSHLNYFSWAHNDITNPGLVQRSMYYRQIKEYFMFFPDKDRYFIVDFEDLVHNTEILANKIFEWVGLERRNVGIPEPENPTPSRSQIEHGLLSLPIPWREMIPSDLGKRALHFLRQFDSSAKRRLSEEEKDTVRKWLRVDIQRFGRTFDFPVEKWGFERKKSYSTQPVGNLG